MLYQRQRGFLASPLKNNLYMKKYLNSPPLEKRRENVFLCLSGFFLCTMCLLNLLGLTYFVQLGPFSISAGVLIYPLTFLCTDLISEIYGRKKAQFLVTLGFVLNLFILTYLYTVKLLPESNHKPPWQDLNLATPLNLPDGSVFEEDIDIFSFIMSCMTGSVGASMIAYLLAQYWDIHFFHWLKKKTRSKHLWLRNNLSTITSQFIDTIFVMSIVFAGSLYRQEMSLEAFFFLLLSNYGYKCLSAFLDTPLCYLIIFFCRKYLRLNQEEEVT